MGGGTSGTPEGRLKGVHPTPPGPINIVTGLLEGPKVVVVMVDDSVENLENVVGTKVSVSTNEPTVPVTTVPLGGSGTLDFVFDGGNEAPGKVDGGGRSGTPSLGSKSVHPTPEGPTVTVTVLLRELTIVVVIMAVTVES